MKGGGELVLGLGLPSCANSLSHVTLLVLRLACLSDVKVVFWHVSEHVNLQVSVSWYKLVT